MKTKKPDDRLTYQLFKSLEKDGQLSQRALSVSLGVSLGKINYCLKALITKGWVKARNFSDSPNKTGYLYVLTPRGLEEKAKVTRRFLSRKLEEYDVMQREIAELQKEVTGLQEEETGA
jgi:EPS-associated MarR family transcriptional regulator